MKTGSAIILFAILGPALSPVVANCAEIALVGARIYASPEAHPIDDGVVILRDGHIVSVGARSNVKVPQTARVIDVHGDTVTAGFWNSHIHLMIPDLLGAATADPKVLESTLQAMLTKWGFTTVFDLASFTDNALALRSRIEHGDLAGPMILTVGDPFFPVGGTPIYVREFLQEHGNPNFEVATPEAAAKRAKRDLERGTDGVKIFAGAIVGGQINVLPMRVDIAKAIVDEAHRHGKPAFAHPTNLAGLNVALAAGVDILAHTTEREKGIAGWPADLIARLRSHDTAVIPTMTLFAQAARKAGESPAELARDIENMTAEVRNYHAAGGQILFGTDVGYIDVFDTTEEYRLMSGALDWRQILESLTTAPATRFGFAAHKGRIAAGMDADLVVLGADPAKDPTALAQVRYTIRSGQVIWQN